MTMLFRGHSPSGKSMSCKMLCRTLPSDITWSRAEAKQDFWRRHNEMINSSGPRVLVYMHSTDNDSLEATEALEEIIENVDLVYTFPDILIR